MSEKQWTDQASKHLKGKTVQEVRYLTKKEIDGLMWYEKALVIFFTDGSYIFPSQDDEGNGPGSLFTSFKDMPTIPTI